MIQCTMILLLTLCSFWIRTSLAETIPSDTQTDYADCASDLSEADAEIFQALFDAGAYDHTESRLQATYHVPLAFHIVTYNDGSGGISQAQLDYALGDLEDVFDDMGICFYVAYQEEINSSAFYLLTNDTERENLLLVNNQANMVDCYFVGYDRGLCGESAFSWHPVAQQGITFKNSCVGVGIDPSTFPHEVGHYFDLFHTHETALGVECPSGSNGASAGDWIADTPADPGLNTGNVLSNCLYTGSESISCDAALWPYSPDTENVMSTSRKTCRTLLTAGQRARVLATLTGPRWGEVGFNAPNFTCATPAGWSSFIVPRANNSATHENCIVSTTLSGNTASTYINQSVYQSNSSVFHPGVISDYVVDNESRGDLTYPGNTWSGFIKHLNWGPFTIKGGRHSLHVHQDVEDYVCETNENDNTAFSQWVWSPEPWGDTASMERTHPPHGMASHYTYPNCDGFEFTGSSWWSVVSIHTIGDSFD